MSVVGELYCVRWDAWVCSIDACNIPSPTWPVKPLGKVREREHVIFLGKKFDVTSRELYLIVLTRFGVGVVHPSTL